MTNNSMMTSPPHVASETMLQAAMARKSDANEMQAPPAYKSKGLNVSKEKVLKMLKEKNKRQRQRRISSNVSEVSDGHQSPSPGRNRRGTSGKTTVLGQVKNQSSIKSLDFGMASLSESQQNAYFNPAAESSTANKDTSESPDNLPKVGTNNVKTGARRSWFSPALPSSLPPSADRSKSASWLTGSSDSKLYNGNASNAADIVKEETNMDVMLNDVLNALVDLPKRKKETLQDSLGSDGDHSNANSSLGKDSDAQ